MNIGAPTSARSDAMHSTATPWVVRSSSASVSSRSSLRAVSTSACPRAASSRAKAAPMPDEAPVTRADEEGGMAAPVRRQPTASARRGERPPAGRISRSVHRAANHVRRSTNAPSDRYPCAPFDHCGDAMRRPLVAGNWKMHGSREMAAALVGEIVAALPADADVAVLPPFPYLGELVQRHAGSGLEFGAQDLSEHGQGA